MNRFSIVLDVGKTNSKASLWDPQGRMLERRMRSNSAASGGSFPALDVDGIDTWLLETLADYAGQGDIGTIVPVAHGAAAALISSGKLYAAPMDYEVILPRHEDRLYEGQRDPFAATGSPSLPSGLNLGRQLHLLESMTGPWPTDLQILLWPQYWAWRLCDVVASEVTSLGCHSDLWNPHDRRYSDLAERRGWAKRFGPVRHAGDVLGPISGAVAAQTGLPTDCQVLVGLHDSNAALLAARGHRDIECEDSTVVSTGTWFVAMRSPLAGGEPGLGNLAEANDCLINVDINGNAVPSSRFMGGREAELIVGHGTHTQIDTESALGRLDALVKAGSCLRPSICKGSGPFPKADWGWAFQPTDPIDVQLMVDWYLALMTDVILDQIGSCGPVLIEGRFAESALFVRALATLRPLQRVLVSSTEHDVSFGALRLIDPHLPPPGVLTRVAPSNLDLKTHAVKWRAQIGPASGDAS